MTAVRRLTAALAGRALRRLRMNEDVAAHVEWVRTGSTPVEVESW